MDRTALSALGSALDELGVRWVLIGALAANLYRRSPRLTGDVDLLLASAGPGLDALEAHLRGLGWQVHRADPAGELLRLRHLRFGVADLLIAGTDYQRQSIERARTEWVDEAAVRVLTPEDVIVHKLIAGRAQDVADIEAVLGSGVEFDETYVEQWAAFWDVLELWRSLR